MNIDLSHEQLLGLLPSWYDLVSDRVGEFDDILLRPMNNMDLIAEETERLIEDKKNNDPMGPDTQTSDLIRAMLQRLSDAGEDIARIYKWSFTLDSDIREFDPIWHGAWRAYYEWPHTFAEWSPKHLAKLDRDGPDIRDTLYAS